MPYIIDGHNLIPKIPGLNLQDVDDEMQLIGLLQGFCRHKQQKVEVYFDRAPAGFGGTRRFGQVTAHFVRSGLEADDAIIQRLLKMGRKARNWSVVTSDRRIQAQVRSSYATVILSEAFAGELMAIQQSGVQTAADGVNSELSSAEVDEWLDLFSKKGPPG